MASQLEDVSKCMHTPISFTHTHLKALFPGLPRWACTRKVKPVWILLKQESVSGSGISWAICKSAPSSRQITMPAPHHSVFYRPDALPAAQPTVSKHWRHCLQMYAVYARTVKWTTQKHRTGGRKKSQITESLLQWAYKLVQRCIQPCLLDCSMQKW